MPPGRRVCPRCGSTRLGHDPGSILSRLSLDHSQRCGDCGYTGFFPVIAEEEMDTFQEEVVENPEVEVEPAGTTGTRSHGRLVIGILMLVMGVTASATAAWGNGLLPGLLAMAVGAAIIFEYLTAAPQE